MQMLILCSGEISPSAVSLFSSMNISIGAEYPVKLMITHCKRLLNNDELNNKFLDLAAIEMLFK